MMLICVDVSTVQAFKFLFCNRPIFKCVDVLDLSIIKDERREIVDIGRPSAPESIGPAGVELAAVMIEFFEIL